MIIIRCVHSGRGSPQYPQFRDDVLWEYTRIPSFHWNSLRWFRFFREIKSCMVLIWAVPSDWSKNIPRIAKWFFRVCGRIILKKPWSGPGVVFDQWKTQCDPSLLGMADLVLVNEKQFEPVIKEA